MFKPKATIQHRKYHKASGTLPDEFGLICWNTHKKNQTLAFHAYITQLQSLYPSSLFLFQEAHEPIHQEFVLNEFETIYAANLQMKTKSYGILTASDTHHREASCLLSQHQELFFKTHKSTLISSYPLVDGQHVLVVNIHAINFKSAKVYRHEMSILLESLLEHKGPLIIAGDFNTWNNRRNDILASMQEILSLEKVIFKNDQHIKCFRQFPLDHIFYRGLEIVTAEAVNAEDLSDHNPLYTCFRLAK